MDFIERLEEEVNRISDLPIACKIGYLDVAESFVVYPLPGSQVVKTYMDGTTDQRLNYEFAMKSKRQSSIHSTLWSVQNVLESLGELLSSDDSYEFKEIKITDKPFISNADDQGFFTFILNIQAEITTQKRGE